MQTQEHPSNKGDQTAAHPEATNTTCFDKHRRKRGISKATADAATQRTTASACPLVYVYDIPGHRRVLKIRGGSPAQIRIRVRQRRKHRSLQAAFNRPRVLLGDHGKPSATGRSSQVPTRGLCATDDIHHLVRRFIRFIHVLTSNVEFDQR